ncbi:polymorphic toxin-type HINT domain-containing protein [Micromonospora purpureochromogenes]|uniref:polymorphic toxin-type HINT domain-containing protein n=1 Tax=Micromonospora purpureochromogenes TaxID=47872 RepID=UPI0033224505
MVPVIGEVADVANGIWYLAEGNYVDAAMSMASAIPLAGNAVAAAKLAKTGKKIADGIGTTNDTRKAAEAGTAGAKGTSPTGTPQTPPTKAQTEQPSAPKQDDSCPVSLPNSFPGTKVVMADGTSKAIEELKVGNRVLATDVETGQNQDRTVTNVRSVEGKKTFITFTVDLDGKDGSKTGSITSTDNHLVWLPDAGMWAKAEQLKPGMWLQTAAGAWVKVTVVTRSVKHERVHNLTVDGVHTYYVLANDTPLLVHNCGKNIYDNQGRMKHGANERMTSRGTSGSEPVNGQGALDNSLELTPEAPGQAPRNVGVSDGEIVVLDRTQQVPCGVAGCTVAGGMNNIWHRHVRSWDGLRQEMKNLLTRGKLVDKKGRPRS